MDDGVRLTLDFENSKPVELLDLAASFGALGEEYAEFVHRRGFDPQAGNVRLYISELRSGSIIAELKALADQSSFILEHADVFAAFVANLKELVDFFMGAAIGKPEVTKQQAERVHQFLEPVAKDGGSQLFVNVSGAVSGDVRIEINSVQANAVQNGVKRFLGPPLPSQGFFENEVLYLRQVRDDPRSTVGDRGVIERFSPNAVKLRIGNEAVKRAILEQPYPFKVAYLVDGQMGTVEGSPSSSIRFSMSGMFPRRLARRRSEGTARLRV